MPQETLLKAAIYISRLRDSSPRAHAYRLKCAKALLDLMNDFIAREAKAAVSENKNDPAYLSWEGVAKCLEKSKSAVYTRYGNKG